MLAADRWWKVCFKARTKPEERSPRLQFAMQVACFNTPLSCLSAIRNVFFVLAAWIRLPQQDCQRLSSSVAIYSLYHRTKTMVLQYGLYALSKGPSTIRICVVPQKTALQSHHNLKIPGRDKHVCTQQQSQYSSLLHLVFAMPFDPSSDNEFKKPFKPTLKPTTKPTLEPASSSQPAPKAWTGSSGNALKSGLAAARAPSHAPTGPRNVSVAMGDLPPHGLAAMRPPSHAPTGPRNMSVAMGDVPPRGPRIQSVVMAEDGSLVDATRLQERKAKNSI